ncbi:pyruvate carboxylase, partial [Aduncisulcus paluster]
MGSDIYFHGLEEGETCEVEIEEGKTLVVKLLEIGKVDLDGRRRLAFEVNGNRRDVMIEDKSSVATSIGGSGNRKVMADPLNPLEIGASIPGKVVK